MVNAILYLVGNAAVERRRDTAGALLVQNLVDLPDQLVAHRPVV
jgi:hypothetical protein